MPTPPYFEGDAFTSGGIGLEPTANFGRTAGGVWVPMQVSAAGLQLSAQASGAPSGAVQIIGASGNVANANAVATLAAAVGKTTYITGFELTASGATAGLAVNATVAGLLGGTETFTFVFPAGALVAAQPLIVNFPTPLPASAPNTAIVVTLPAGGAGNTNAAAAAQGYQL